MFVNQKWLPGLACVMLVVAGGCSSATADPVKPAADAKGDAAASKDDKPFVVPKDATPEQLIDFVADVTQMEPAVQTRAALEVHFTKVAKAVLEATERILNAKKIDERMTLDALGARFEAYEIQVLLEVKDADKARHDLAKKYRDDSRAKVATLAKGKLLVMNLQQMEKLKPAEQTALVADAVDYLKGLGTPGQAMFRKSVVKLGSLFEHGGNDLVSAQAYDAIAGLFEKSDDPDAEPIAVRLRKMAGRMRMVGKPLEVEGQTTAGQPIDWASYRGKVVLVDFWATWCPKCVQELPDLVKLREELGPKGFEIVGVNLDDNRRSLDKFLAQNELPWSNLFDEHHEMHPIAEKYGVVGLPVNMLVGRDGKVVKLNLHGKELKEALEKLLGPSSSVKQK